MRNPVYPSRPVAPEAARFGRCQRINDFIVLSEGTSNVYLIETPEGNILVNSGMGFEAPVHKANLEQFATGPITHLITTQGHVDHLGGVQYFRDLHPGLSYIAQADNAEHQCYDNRLQPFRAARSAFRFQDDFTEVFTAYAKAGYTDINPQDHPTPDQVFDDKLVFNVGELDIELIAVAGAETNDSLVIWLPQHRIALTGNLFGCPFGHFPNLSTIRGDRYRDPLVCLEAANTVLKLAPAMILYGHHGPVVGEQLIAEELVAYRDAIAQVHDAVVDGMNAGKSIEQLQQAISLSPECEVGEGYGKVSWGVRAIWEYYAGWFKHQSTTELYSVPRSSIDSDLLDLIGAEALVGRARQRFDGTEHEAALHLLDIVLGAEPKNTAAIELSIEIHQALLIQAQAFKHTGNFWLEGWLANQIKLLQGGKTAPLTQT